MQHSTVMEVTDVSTFSRSVFGNSKTKKLLPPREKSMITRFVCPLAAPPPSQVHSYSRTETERNIAAHYHSNFAVHLLPHSCDMKRKSPYRIQSWECIWSIQYTWPRPQQPCHTGRVPGRCLIDTAMLLVSCSHLCARET